MSRRAGRLAARSLAAAVSALAVGCGAYERAELEITRRTPAAWAPEGVLLAPGRAQGDGPAAGRRVTLAASGGTSRAALGLVASALELVGAHGRARSVVDGLEHFSREDGARVTVRLERAGGRGGETWLVDRSWALRRMRCGATLVWQGDLAPVLARLSLVLPARAAP